MICEYHNLIQNLLDGKLASHEQCLLEEHISVCPSCREEYQALQNFQKLVSIGLAPDKSTLEATREIMAQLDSVPTPTIRTRSFFSAAMAAAVLVFVTGLVTGYFFRQNGFTPVGFPLPIQVTELKGTVLVRHQGGNIWHELQSSMSIYPGDEFRSTSQSGMTLQLPGDSRMELATESFLGVIRFADSHEFSLKHGSVKAVLTSPHPAFFVDTPQGRVEALGTEFTITVQ